MLLIRRLLVDEPPSRIPQPALPVHAFPCTTFVLELITKMLAWMLSSSVLFRTVFWLESSRLTPAPHSRTVTSETVQPVTLYRKMPASISNCRMVPLRIVTLETPGPTPTPYA